MAFFKFRKGGEDAPTSPAAPESVQAMRTRARHRLIGASVLVLAGVIGFPLLFDNQPRPIAVDIPIDIPDKNKVKPLGNQPVVPAAAQSGGVIDESAPPPLAAATPAAPETPPKAAPAPAAVAQVAPKEEIVAPAKPQPAPVAAKPEAKPEPKPDPKPEPKPAPKPTAEAAKAQALLEGKEPVKPEPKPAATAPAAAEHKADAGKGRFVVQVGSFTDLAKAREARLKMEKAGFKTYTQEVQLKEGKRLRVRIGPFETRALAEKAADKAKKLDLSGAILEL